MRVIPGNRCNTPRRAAEVAGRILILGAVVAALPLPLPPPIPAARAGAAELAQAAPDAPAMKLGDRYQQPKGVLEILGLTREPKEGGTEFVVVFRFITDRESVGMNVHEFVRLYADGIPRAPTSASSSIAIPREAALEFNATFTVPGEPREVVLQFGYPDTPRTRRRWPG